MAELAGAMVGNYFLLERLSSQGIVETYLARPTTHGGYDVHLRLFRPRLPDAQAFQEQFSTEVRKVWRCQHQHIQPLTEFGAGEGIFYTTTRADEALTLEQALTKLGNTQLPVSQVAKLIAQLCEALQYAHERGIVHGNLQPSSIVLVSANQVQLTDFGLRQAYREGDPVCAQIEEGNAAYVAPEQVVGMLHPASDIYALGVLLYRLLGGVLPYAGESAQEMALAHAHEPIPSLRALRPDLPVAIDGVVHMALARSPAARFATPHALAAALIQALTQNKAPDSAPDTLRHIVVHPRRTTLTWSRALSLLALALVLLGLSSTFYLFLSPGSPLGNIPGFPLSLSHQPGSSSIFFPALRPSARPSPSPSSGITSHGSGAASQSTVVPTPGDAREPAPTPDPATSTPGIQLSPIVFPATPTPSPLACVPGSLSIDGSFYLAPLLQQIGTDYQTFCPGATLRVSAQGCQAGLKALEHGQVNLAASDLSAHQAQGETDYPVVALLYAVIVSPDIQMSGLSSQQLQAIYQGQVTNWSQLGGPDESIKVLLHPASDPLNAIFQAFVLNGATTHVQGLKLSKKTSPIQVVQKVAQTPGAISTVSLAVAGSANVRVLALNRVEPTPQNVLQGAYPLWSIEHLYASPDATAQAQAYIQFLQSQAEANRLAQSSALTLNAFSSAVLASHLPGPYISA